MASAHSLLFSAVPDLMPPAIDSGRIHQKPHLLKNHIAAIAHSDTFRETIDRQLLYQLMVHELF